MSRIFLDTNVLIYFIEDEGELGRQAFALIERMSERRDEVLTSALTLGEILTRPIEMSRQDIADRYESLLLSSGVRLLSFDRAGALAYARIRSDRSIKPPDALQLAVASSAGCDLFITNDRQLTKKVVPGIQFIVTPDRAPL